MLSTEPPLGITPIKIITYNLWASAGLFSGRTARHFLSKSIRVTTRGEWAKWSRMPEAQSWTAFAKDHYSPRPAQ